MNSTSATLICNRIENSLWLEWIADAISMPAHWYYDVVELQNTYGSIQSYLPDDPSHPHPDSWIYFQHIKPEEEQSGWPFQIFHNNPHLFQEPGTHYHHAMQAGESTLHARVQELLMQSLIGSISQEPKLLYDRQDFCKRWFTFMTTPGAHPDTYIGGAMRYFFQQYARDPSSFTGKGYNDPCVSGITLVLPLLHLLLELVAALLWRAEEAIGEPVKEAERILRQALQRMMDTNLEAAKDAEVVCGLPGVKLDKETGSNSSEVATEPSAASSSNEQHAAADSSSASNDPAYKEWKASLQAPSGQKFTLEQVMKMSNRDAFDTVFSIRCYAERALPGALYLALKACHLASARAPATSSSSSSSSPCEVKSIVTETLVSNAQLAGDNAHRGMILGMLLGLIFGNETDCSTFLISSEFKTQLRKHSNQNTALASLFHTFAETLAQISVNRANHVQSDDLAHTPSTLDEHKPNQ